jgi:hypothetical protein
MVIPYAQSGRPSSKGRVARCSFILSDMSLFLPFLTRVPLIRPQLLMDIFSRYSGRQNNALIEIPQIYGYVTYMAKVSLLM